MALHLNELWYLHLRIRCAQFSLYRRCGFEEDKKFQKILIISPWKRVCPLILTNITSIQRCFVQTFIESGTVVLENKSKSEYIYIYRQMDTEHKVIGKAQFSFQVRCDWLGLALNLFSSCFGFSVLSCYNLFRLSKYF